MKEVTEQDVEHVRELVGGLLEAEEVDDDKAQVLQLTQGDALVRRFIRAASGNHKAAAKRLVATARWRLKERPERLVCAACAKSVHSHYMHPIGHDRHGRPVFFSSYILIEDAAAHGATQHMLCEFERAVQLMPPGVEAWTWVMDFRGYGRRLADLSPTLAVNFLHLSAAHYPERLGALWILDAPGILTPVWRWLKPMIDPVTHAKFRFLPFDVPRDASLQAPAPAAAQGDGDAPPPAPGAADPHASQLWAALCELGDEELARWVVEEMRAARAWDEGQRGKRGKAQQAGGVHRPVYDLALLQRGLAEAQGVPELLAKLGPPEGAGGAPAHSHYGTQAFLAKLLLQARPAADAAPPAAAAVAQGSTAA